MELRAQFRRAVYEGRGTAANQKGRDDSGESLGRDQAAQRRLDRLRRASHQSDGMRKSFRIAEENIQRERNEDLVVKAQHKPSGRFKVSAVS